GAYLSAIPSNPEPVPGSTLNMFRRAYTAALLAWLASTIVPLAGPVMTFRHAAHPASGSATAHRNDGPRLPLARGGRMGAAFGGASPRGAVRLNASRPRDTLAKGGKGAAHAGPVRVRERRGSPGGAGHRRAATGGRRGAVEARDRGPRPAHRRHRQGDPRRAAGRAPPPN